MTLNDWDWPFHEDESTYDIVAFNDVVGVACSEACAQTAIDDIVGDHGEAAEAGMDRRTLPAREGSHCMGCGKVVA